jgi:hypothetical protein
MKEINKLKQEEVRDNVIIEKNKRLGIKAQIIQKHINLS